MWDPSLTARRCVQRALPGLGEFALGRPHLATGAEQLQLIMDALIGAQARHGAEPARPRARRPSAWPSNRGPHAGR